MRGEKLVSWINSTAEKHRFRGVELATVQAVEPELKIKIDGMNIPLGSSFLIIPQSFVEEQIKLTANWEVTAQTVSGSTGSADSHTHSVPPLQINAMSVAEQDTVIKRLFQPNDRLAVLPALDGKRFMVLDKVVIL